MVNPVRVSTRPRKAVNEPRADDVVAMCAVGAGMIQRAAEYEDLAKLATVQKSEALANKVRFGRPVHISR
jgi:hypothetical protein